MSQLIAYCLSSSQQPESLGRDPKKISRLHLQGLFGTALGREHRPLSYQPSLANELHAGHHPNSEYQPQLYAQKLQCESLSNATDYELKIAGRRSVWRVYRLSIVF